MTTSGTSAAELYPDATLPTGSIIPILDANLYGSATKNKYLQEAWYPCNGDQLSMSTYSDLYEVIGTRYNTGGEALSGNFRVPNLENRIPYPTSNSSANIGATGGSNSVTLTQNQIPKHRHMYTMKAHIHTVQIYNDDLNGVGGTYNFYKKQHEDMARDSSHVWPVKTAWRDGVSMTSGGTTTTSVDPIDITPSSAKVIFFIKT